MQPLPPPAVGDRCGRYQLEALLGQGATGSVWRAALHGPEGFRKQVALKLLRDGAVTEAGPPPQEG